MPNYIFPFDSSTFFSVANSQYFQYLMYRPLYWFGKGASPTLNSSLSLADPPSYNGNNVTINLKGWKWSNGKQITAQNVLFWLNMLQAVGASDWGAYVPGGFPTNVSNIKAVNADHGHDDDEQGLQPDLVHLQRAEPDHPDAGGLGPHGERAERLRHQGVRLRGGLQLPGQPVQGPVGLGGSPLWSIVDGPWKLTAFNSDGNATFVPNATYGGSPQGEAGASSRRCRSRPSRPSTTCSRPAARAAATRDRRRLPADHRRAAQLAPNATAGRNPVSGYYLSPLYSWGINYFPLNYQSTTGNGPILKQLYFRQALQLGDEPGGGDHGAAQGVRPADGRPGRHATR